MKKIMLIIFLLPVLIKAQNRYTVSNVPGVKSNFKTLQGAHDSVAAGSILYVLPSSYSYGDVVFTKSLTVYGTGYFLGQNLEPNTQASSAPVLINSIRFRQGSDNSYIEGLQLIYQAQQSTNRITLDTVSNVTISRCLLISPIFGAYGVSHSFFFINGANNCIIKQCYIQNINGYTVPRVVNYLYGSNPNFSGIQFVNNIFDWAPIGGNGFSFGPDVYGGFQANGSYNLTIANNTFIVYLKNSQFGNLNYTNNIFINSVPSDSVVNPTYTYLNGTNLNNITNVASLFITPDNNYQGANADSLFVYTSPGYHSIDQKWMVKNGSFAKTFGQGGIEAGAYGTANPYKLSGIPDLPFIYNITVPSQATAPGTISVRIKAKASN